MRKHPGAVSKGVVVATSLAMVNVLRVQTRVRDAQTKVAVQTVLMGTMGHIVNTNAHRFVKTISVTRYLVLVWKTASTVTSRMAIAVMFAPETAIVAPDPVFVQSARPDSGDPSVRGTAHLNVLRVQVMEIVWEVRV